jgi:hypothetical protein
MADLLVCSVQSGLFVNLGVLWEVNTNLSDEEVPEKISRREAIIEYMFQAEYPAFA